MRPLQIELTARERVYQLALEQYRYAEDRLDTEQSHSAQKLFDVAKMDLDEALRLVREERGIQRPLGAFRREHAHV